MKKTYVCSTTIRRAAPISAVWEYIDGRFTAHLPGKDTEEWYSLSWYKKIGTTPQEAMESGYFQHLDNLEIFDRVVDVLFLNPQWLESANYYNAFLSKGLGIPATTVDVALKQLGDMAIRLIGYPMIILGYIERITNNLAFTLYSRDPESTDSDYSIDFNYGYKWEWVQITASDLVFKKHNTVYDYLEFTRQQDTMFYKDEFGLNRTLNSYFPVKCNFDFNIGDELWITADIMLNGYYWTNHQRASTTDWKKNSYCYLNGYIMFKIKIYTTNNINVIVEYYDMNDNIINNISTYITNEYNSKKANVGNDYYSTYSTNDIPYNYRIWR